MRLSGGRLVLRLEWSSIELVFRGFNLRPLDFIQRFTRLRQFCRVLVIFEISWPAMNIVVSSANGTVVESVMVLGKSLMKAEKREGPRMDLWGTPEDRGREVEV